MSLLWRRLVLLLVACSIGAGTAQLIAAKPPHGRVIPDVLPAASGGAAELGADRELAFPGAEGFGAYARGGRGGRVLRVTTLEDHKQTGSLRWAIAQRGPRIVEFAVEGIISLRSPLVIEQPFLTLDGSTAR